MPKRRHAATAALGADWIDFLLTGHTRCDGEPPYDCFVEFDPHTPEELQRLWRQHRPALLAEWARRAGVGHPWAAKFDAGPA